MAAADQYERLFGLIGYPLSHSFSKRYFNEKFAREGIAGAFYELFPLEQITAFPALLEAHPNLIGLNVTIPYKQAVIPYLDRLDEGAAQVGAVNTIVRRGGELVGYNTDVIGFEQSLCRWLQANGVKLGGLQALVLGTGGAARAVAYVLGRLGVSFQLVSRKKGEGQLAYSKIDEAVAKAHRLIVNTTPLGMSPNTEGCPALPYGAMGAGHFLYDLVYNPEETRFMENGRLQGAKAMNGLEMLYGQAEAAWAIWNA